MLLSFLIEVFFVTDLWIFLYNNLLALLNFNKHFKVTESFFFPLFVPEPYEIPLYLGLTFVATIALIFIYKVHPQGVLSKAGPRIWRIIILLILLTIFLFSLGSYPMKNDPTTVFSVHNPNENLIFLVYIAVSFIVVAGLLLADLKKTGKRFFLPISLLLIILLSLVTFEPRLPISGHDYSFFLGPIWETAHGKTIYTEVPSQYGFLTILFFTLLSKLGLLTLSNFPFFIWLLYPLQYYLIFYLVYKNSFSYLLAGLATLSILTVNFFSLAYTPLELPQGGPIRLIIPLLILFLLDRYQKIESLRFLFLFAAISLFIVDMGIYMVLGLGFSFFLLFFLERSRRKLFVSSFVLGASFLVIPAVINLIHILFGQKPVDYFFMLGKILQYGRAGYTMLPIDLKTYFWLLPFSFFATVFYLLRKRALENRDRLLLLTACFSFFGGIYYVGRSHPHNLFAVGLMVILTLFLLLAFHLEGLKMSRKILLGSVIFVLFIAYPAFERKDALSVIVTSRIERYTSGKIFYPVVDGYMADHYQKEVELIQREIKEKKMLLLQADETYLFYLTGKENLLMTNPQTFIVSQKDLDFAVSLAEKVCPQKAVLDCRLVGRCPETNYEMFADPRLFIQPKLLNRIETSCGIKYEPTKCTNTLCIAEAKR